MVYRIGYITDTGKMRQTNQDRYIVCIGRINHKSAALLAVADGMGGLESGEEASALTIDCLSRWWSLHNNGCFSIEELSDSLDTGIYALHRALYTKILDLGKEIGTTLSLVLLTGDRYLYKQIGDSRIYLANMSAKRCFRQLTVDQNWKNQMFAAGRSVSDTEVPAQLQHALTNALGVSPELEIASGTGRLAWGTNLLLCSDGFYNGLPGAVERIRVDRAVSPQAQLEDCLAKILAGRAADNITAIWCRTALLQTRGGRHGVV